MRTFADPGGRKPPQFFTRLGAAVTERIYPGMGHLVNDDEIVFARGVMDSVLGLVA